MKVKRNAVLLNVDPRQLSALLRKAQIQNLSNLHINDNRNSIFQLSGKLKGDNQDIVGEKFVKLPKLVKLSDAEKLKALHHCKHVLKMEFPGYGTILEDASAVEGPPPLVRQIMVFTTLKAVKSGKVPEPSGIVVEMLRAGGSNIEERITALPNTIIH